jgi:Pyridoxamine 5'-phosphate oxidase
VGKLYAEIDDKLAAWVAKQRVFFVATAPLSEDGHVNLSPKGPIESLHIAGPRRVAYLDLIGSGAETVAHLHENGRIVIMLCAFEGPPRIVRFHGSGRVVQVGEPGFEELARELDFSGVAAASDGARSIIDIHVRRIADSCGYGVPLMRYEGERTQQLAWFESKKRSSEDALVDYVGEKNARSIDGLPAVHAATMRRARP